MKQKIISFVGEQGEQIICLFISAIMLFCIVFLILKASIVGVALKIYDEPDYPIYTRCEAAACSARR